MCSKCLFILAVINCSLIFLPLVQIFLLESTSLRIPRPLAEFMHTAQTQATLSRGFSALSPFAK